MMATFTCRAVMLLSLLSITCPSAAQDGLTIKGLRQRVMAAARPGNCEGTSGPIEMGQLSPVKKGSVKKRRVVYRIQGNQIVILLENQRHKSVTDVRTILNIGMDHNLVLGFVRLKGEVFLKAEEDVPLSVHKQALLRLNGPSVSVFCSGEAGSDKSH